MAKKKLVPELRFPGFEGEWEEKTLSDLLTFKNGVNASKESYGRGYKFINVLDIIQNDFITYDNIIGSVDISEEEFQKSIVEFGDVLFQRSSETREEVGQANVYLDKNHPVTFGGFVIRGRKKVEYDPVFVNFLLKTAKVRKEITSKSGGSTRYNVSQDTLSSVIISIPILRGQQKIASFLSVIDTRFQLLEKKKKALESYKKGVMQKIFNQEIRFKDDDGKDFPDWEETLFGELYTFKATNSFSRDKLNYTKGTIKNIHYGDIHTKFPSHLNVCRESVPLIREEVNVLRFQDEVFVKEGDLIIADASEDYSDIGKAVEVVNTNGEKILAGLHTILARRMGDKIQIGFGGYLMKSFSFRMELRRIAQGTKVLSISANRLAHIKIKIPSSRKEQQKIASFLSSIDESIDQVDRQLILARNYKKGLLQKMFV